MTPSELDQLADYAEGLLDGTPDGEAVAARIATDQEWSDAYRQLTAVLPGISADLAALPDVPMPVHVAARLDRALVATDPAEEEPATSWKAPEPDELSRLRVEKAARDRAARRWRVAGGWVAAAAVVGALCIGVGQLATSSGDNGDDSAASSAKESESEVLSAPAAPPSTRVSGVIYSTAELGRQARALLGTPVPAASGAPSVPADRQVAAVPTALRRLTIPAELQNCLTALGVAGAPLAVDYATLDGTPAIVVVAPEPDPDRLDVVAAGANCGAGGNSDERARVSVNREG
ncbi:hypothetical protein [Cryptosporangium sp. NPDC048952]|uniref:hypothetical protein n=1 Tax=Cryptosporangium sp. NPDC048952 TaxID=3363961 RepID=UPI00370F80E8